MSDSLSPRMKDGKRVVRFGSEDVSFGDAADDFLKPLPPRGDLLRAGDYESLNQHLAQDGYLYLDGALDRDDVLAARAFILESFADQGDILDPHRPMHEAVLRERCGLGCVPFLEGRNKTTHHPVVLRVFESDRLKKLFCGLFGVDAVRTFDFKWLRAVPNNTFTGAHLDVVYMNRGSANLKTCWIPFGDISMDLGALAMCEGSNRLDGFRRLHETYGKLDHERDNLDGTGWFSLSPRECTELFGGQWRSTDFRAGDIMVFGMHTLHMSTTNMTNRVRISADVRWQPADEPADPRYVGDVEGYVKNMEVAGAWKTADGETDMTRKIGEKKAVASKVTMASLRGQWGFPVPVGQEVR